ncbi:MAG: efflux RND transporter periplasmic adaptor subunit, partial [Pseudomonadota bacterium]
MNANSEKPKHKFLHQRCRYLWVLIGAAACLANSSFVFSQDALPVAVMPLVRIAIANEVDLTGSLIAHRISSLSSEVEGIVEQISVDDGHKVKRGDAIVQLNQDIAKIAKDTAAAELAESEATLKESIRRHAELERLKDSSHASRSSVEAAKAQISIDEASRARAISNLRRATTLLNKHSILSPFAGIVNRKLVEIGQWIDTTTPLVELVDSNLLRL